MASVPTCAPYSDDDEYTADTNSTTPDRESCDSIDTPPSEDQKPTDENDHRAGHLHIATQQDKQVATADVEEPSTSSSPPGSTSSLSPTTSMPFTVTKSKIRLNITSDTTCPWCFIAKRRITKAIDMFYALATPENDTRKVRFDIHWYPYQLDPQAPALPIPKKNLYTRKFGPERAILVKDRIVQIGKAEGITFVSADSGLYCSTLDSHRLIRYARERLGRKLFGEPLASDSNDNDSEDEDAIDEFGNRMEDAMVDELFQSHFERGECGDLPTLKLCTRNVLLQLAAEHEAIPGNASIDRDELENEVAVTEQYLATDEDLQEIKDEIRWIKQQLEIQGVPTIVVQNMYLLPGGQEATTFLEIFKRVV
ncbi:hypothetical protein BGZ99_002695 [Dissophora globulifera]|uniref:DSBA-like thioredoxin domain-containing protein n=1 Tax=Dissophora globulifera TaxID=979702 RepID=A0A9P6UXE2_9FUNG|nr:hypothetical protein BGZ99_002695 [Dissophora globulifera]